MGVRLRPDPLKLGAMQILQRHHDRCAAAPGNTCVAAEDAAGWRAFQRGLVLAGKHTWGGHTIVEDDGKAADTTHYTAAQLAQVRWSATGFITQQLSWDEMRLQLWAVRAVLGPTSVVGAAIDEEMKLLTGGPAATEPLGTGPGWSSLAQDQWSKSVVIGGLKVALDSATGAIVTLARVNSSSEDPATTTGWASKSRPLARFAYVTHSGDQGSAFFHNYSFGCPRCGWATEGFTKPGVNSTLANASITRGTVTRMAVKRSSSSSSSSSLDQVQAIAYELQLPSMLWAHYGAPRRVTVEISGSKRGSSLDVALRWLNKTTSRLPESLWLEFAPAVGGDSPVMLGKLGSVVDADDVVVNGTAGLHATDSSGVTFTAAAGTAKERRSVLRIVGHHAPLVATRQQASDLNLWHFPIAPGGGGGGGGGGGEEDASTTNAAERVVAFNMFNNLWNTNYIYWYPWRNASATEDDAAMTFQWTIGLENGEQS